MDITGKELNGQLLDIEEQLMGRVQELNEKYSKVILPTEVKVAHIVKDNFGDPVWAFKSCDEFKKAIAHHPKVVTGLTSSDDEKLEAIGKAWLEHPDARIYEEGVTFHPNQGEQEKGKLNTYFKPTIELNEKSQEENKEIIKGYLGHIYNIICSKDNESYQYVLNWMAHLVQKPEEKPTVALTLVGDQGTGKGKFVEPLGRIIGTHYAHLQSARSITGRFNAALENKILVFGDEFFGGTKEQTDIMKGIISEKRGSIERKGIDEVQVKSFSRMILATNRDHAISIADNERRYCILRISNIRMQNMEYFGKLTEQMESKGWIEALFTWLMDKDISQFDPRRFPQTQELEMMKMHNISPAKAWILECYTRGALAGSGVMRSDDRMMPGDSEKVATTELGDAFKAWVIREDMRKAVKGRAGTNVKEAMDYIGGVMDTNGGRGYKLPAVRDVQDRLEKDLKNYNCD